VLIWVVVNYDWIGSPNPLKSAEIPCHFSNVIPSKGCVKVAYGIVKNILFKHGKIAGNNMGVMTSHKWTRNHRYKQKGISLRGNLSMWDNTDFTSSKIHIPQFPASPLELT